MEPISQAISPATIAPAEASGVSNLVTLAVSVVVVGALYIARDVLIPITLSILLSFLLAPLASLLRRLRIGRVVSVLLAMLLALGVIGGVGGVIGLQISGLSADFPTYEIAMETKLDAVRGWGTGLIKSVDEQLGGKLDIPSAPVARGDVPHVPSGTAQSPVTVQVKAEPPTPLSMARAVLSPLLGPLGTTALVIVVAVFILLQKDDLRDRMIRLFGSSDLHRTTLAMNDAAQRLSKYFLTQLAINTGFGLLITVGLSLLHVPSPALWGLIGTLLRFVPYIGAYAAAVLPVLLAAAINPGWAEAVSTLALFLGSELVIGQAVEPFAYGRSTGLSPFSVVVATIFWAWIWGPIGLVLATPLTLCLVVLGRHVKRLEFLDVLLGDRPALTPVESLYQRMLANDPEEAATQAEMLLRELSLSAYYDEVALKALMLAANDVRRGVLTRERQLVMRDAICGLVEYLDDYEDVPPEPSRGENNPVAPPPGELAVLHSPPVMRRAPPAAELPSVWRSPNAVLCLGGHSPLDDAAAAMMAQLLGKHGLNARAEWHEAAARPAIGNLRLADVAAVCISYMGATGSPAHLRFLLRRLRQLAPHAQFVVALWAIEGDPTIEPVGIDARAASLRDVLSRCLDAAQAAATDPAQAIEREAVGT
jgi:predicted PurR-regulated permease PerM